MKKLLFSFCLLGLSVVMANAQQLFFEVSSGYNITAYKGPEYAKSTGYVPIRLRLAGGHEYVQIGVEADQNITNPAFKFTGAGVGGVQASLSQEFENKYYGLFVRGNISSLPAYRFGLIVSAGAGYYNTTSHLYELPGEKELNDPVEYKKTLGLNGRIGISSPIYTLLHWEIGYQFNYMNYKEDNFGPLTDSFSPYYHSIQAGLSVNLVFGNVEKKCRQVMSGNRSKRGW